jgi:hypothetical protein
MDVHCKNRQSEFQGTGYCVVLTIQAFAAFVKQQTSCFLVASLSVSYVIILGAKYELIFLG